MQGNSTSFFERNKDHNRTVLTLALPWLDKKITDIISLSLACSEFNEMLNDLNITQKNPDGQTASPNWDFFINHKFYTKTPPQITNSCKEKEKAAWKKLKEDLTGRIENFTSSQFAVYEKIENFRDELSNTPKDCCFIPLSWYGMLSLAMVLETLAMAASVYLFSTSPLETMSLLLMIPAILLPTTTPVVCCAQFCALSEYSDKLTYLDYPFRKMKKKHQNTLTSITKQLSNLQIQIPQFKKVNDVDKFLENLLTDLPKQSTLLSEGHRLIALIDLEIASKNVYSLMYLQDRKTPKTKIIDQANQFLSNIDSTLEKLETKQAAEIKNQNDDVVINIPNGKEEINDKEYDERSSLLRCQT